MLKRIICFVCLVFLLEPVSGQVTVHINSGNPAFPYPQFLDYGPDRKTLASVNAPGVTHAEMEQKTRDAWQIFANSFVYSGEEFKGVKYIKGNVGCPYDCSEGDGYALIAAAAMGDKPTFDGLWMRTHDVRMVKHPRYIDGVVPRPDYKYGDNTLAEPGGDAATDGDFDIALGILLAWKQWGDLMGITDFSGKPISYKEAALNVMKGIVEKKNSGLGDCRSVSGNVGFDGYVKNGNTWTELTTWASNRTPECPEYKGPQFLYVDYIAPAYLHAFGKVLEAENADAWDISQMKRAEASSDWIMGQAIKNPNGIPWAGNMRLDANGLNPTFSKFNEGEDFRMPWRTILNYVWHGNATTSWDPVTHEVVNTPNTYEKDNAVRLAKFLSNPQGAPWSNGCDTYGGGPDLTYKGPSTLTWYSSPLGVKSTDGFTLNWIHGTGSPAAVGAQDFDLMGKMFRQCVIEWEHADGTDNYLGSKPRYFHGWFRLLGMLVLSGNHHSPLNMVAKPNLKVYNKIDKTYGFTNDQVTYTVSYRNYGSVDATGTIVKFGIPSGFQFISASNGGVLAGDSVTWNVGTVKGFKSDGLAATVGSMTVTLQIGPNSTGRYCTNARISSTNGLGWVSNEYPNNKSAVLERNCVDVIKRALKITKTADRKEYNPGQEVKYKIKFENSSDAGWLNGGRPGVTIGFAHMKGMANPASANQNELKFRLYHDAVEPYIDYGNYRVSYFVNDPSIKCYFNAATCPNGWELQNTIKEGVNPDSVKAFQENIVAGSDAQGNWNQRIVLQFSHQLATTTQHLSNYYGLGIRVHEGGTEPLRGVWRWYPKNYNNVDWSDDWSWDPDAGDDDAGLYFPVGDDYTDIFNPGRPVTSWHTSACQVAPKIVKNVLVEEFDGYTWRRAYGNGPSPGRDLENITVIDTLPAGVTFKNFIRQKALGIDATTSTIAGGRTVITWSIPKMQVNQKDSLLFTATVNGTCPNLPPASLVNKAWIKAATESAIFDGDTVNVSCVPVAICPAPTSLLKTSDKTKYTVGEQVKYSLQYTQTQGSIANPDLSLAADWVAQSGTKSIAQFAVGGITLPGMSDGTNIVLTHDYSYGTNTLGNGIEGTFQMASSENQFALVVRHSGGAVANGVYINFKSSGGTNPTTVDIYSGTTKLNAAPFSIPFSSSTYDFRIQLNGGTLSMWLVASGDEISGAAPIVQTGIPERAGFAGISHGAISGGGPNYGTHKLINWKAHVDAAFNVQVTDSVPTGISTPINITNAGVLAANTITWTLSTGKTPLAYNAKALMAWEGTYTTCAKVTNKAFVNTMGITGNQLGVCYDITCGTAPVCAQPTSVVLNDTTMTVGGTTILRARAMPVKADYIYNFYRVYNNSTVLLQTGAQNTLTVSDTGRYIVRVADLDTANAQCYRVSNLAKVSYGCVAPTQVAVNNASLTVGGTTTLTAVATPDRTGYIYSWYKLPNTATTLPGSGIDKKTITVSDTGRYIVRVADQDTVNSSCYLISSLAKVSYGCIKPTVTVRDTTLELGKTTVLTVLVNPQKMGYFYSWYKLPNLSTTLPGSGLDKSSITVSDTGNYQVRVTDIDSTNSQCFTFSDTIKVRIGCTPPVALITNTTPISYCANTDGVTLTAQTVAGMDYQWYKGTLPVGTNANTLTNADSGTYTVRVGKGTCADTSAPVAVLRTPQPLAEIDTVASNRSYCIGTPGGELTAKTAGQGATYLWVLGGAAQGTASAQTTLNPATQGSWQVITTANGCSDTSTAVAVKEVQTIVSDIQIEADRTEACVGTPVNVTVTNKTDGTVQWYQDNVLQPITGTTYTFNFAKNTRIKAYLVSSLSCANPKDDSASVDITLNTIEASIALEVDKTLPVCEGEALSFVAKTTAGVTNGTYVWTVDNQAQTSTDSLFTSSVLTNRSLVKVSTFDACTPTKEVSDTLLVRLTPKVTPYVTLKSMGGLVCQGQEVTFRIDTLQGGGTDPLFTWHVNGVQEGTSADTFKTSINASSDVFVKLTSNALCADPIEVNSKSIVLDITQATAPSVTIAQTPTICPDQTTGTFTVTSKQGEGPTPTYRWYVSGELKQSTSAETFSYPLTGGEIVYAVLKSDLPCRTEDSATSATVTYQVAEPITARLYNNINNAYGQGLCRNATPPPSFEVISNQASLTYEWRVNSDPTGQTGNVAVFPSLNTGDTIRVKVALAACPNLNVGDWMTVTVDDKPLEGFKNSKGDITVCLNHDTTLVSAEENPAYTFTWKKGSQVVLSGLGLTQYTITESDGYTLEVTNGGCTSRTEVRVRQAALDIEASADPTSFVPGEVVKATVKGGENFNSLTYTWTPASVFQPSSTDKDVTLFPQETMTIKVVVRAIGGCVDSSTILLTKMDKLFIPNAITPETGDQNAFWDIKGTEAYQELEVRVYNRWGSLVHEQRGYAKPWDGTLNGKPLPTGTYYYVLKHAKFDKPKAGDLTIVR